MNARVWGSSILNSQGADPVLGGSKTPTAGHIDMVPG